MNSADLYTGRRLMTGTTTCYQCNKPMKPTATDLCDECSEHLLNLVGSPTVDMYGIPKEDKDKG